MDKQVKRESPKNQRSTAPARVLLITGDAAGPYSLPEVDPSTMTIPFELEQVQGVQQGLSSLAQGKVDAVVLNLAQPGQPDFNSFASIYDQASNIPLIVIISVQHKTLALQMVEHGAHDYLYLEELDGNLLGFSIRCAIQSRLILKKNAEELESFAYMVAHDLQAPLATVIGFATALTDYHRTMTQGELQHYLQAMTRSARLMNNIIEELLLLAGVDRSEVKLYVLDMADIVAKSQQRLVYMIEEYKAEFVVPDTWPVALGHAPWVEEVWVNYISHAIKHSSQPPRLELGGSNGTDGMARFWLRANGPGIPEEEQAQLLAPFTQLDKVRATGRGLGLSIVKRIVEKLGGQVWIESEEITGRGSMFNFSLPQAPVS
jgi:signal transduction histidine kinase